MAKKSNGMKRFGLILLLLFSLPILLHVYNPSFALGGVGLMLGAIGWLISPILIFAFMIYYIVKNW